MVRQVSFAAALAVAIACAAGSATASPVAGGPVDSGVFISAGLGSGVDYTYLTTVSPFTGSGGGSLTLRQSDYIDSFGYSTTSMTSMTPIFSSAATVGSSTTISPTGSFLFYFNTQGSGTSGTGGDPVASVFTNGTTTPSSATQVNLAIYRNSTTNTYAFFFDDGGPSGCTTGVNNGNGNCTGQGIPLDDNDYNDLVVTYTPASTTVPEPMSLGLLGMGLVGVGMARRTRSRA